ncbi:MAG: flagellar basal body-associated FliL family protein [Nitrospira sp.]|nr:MAG: flagellar basal body-associated FliL family protein [Nitrospira sp.]
MTVRFTILILAGIVGILIFSGYMIGLSYKDIMPRTFSLQTNAKGQAQTPPGVMINLPAVVAPVDDGRRYYYVQVSVAVEIDRLGTAGLIQARHDVIDRKILEIFHAYSPTDLQTAGQSPTLRQDIKQAINELLPRGRVKNVYITNWLMTPVGS